jgi:hypothetical protein
VRLVDDCLLMNKRSRWKKYLFRNFFQELLTWWWHTWEWLSLSAHWIMFSKVCFQCKVIRKCDINICRDPSF